MLLSILPVAFADADRQRQYQAVLAALQAEAEAPATVLLGNLGAFTPIEADVLLVRPAALVLVVLAPRAGQLTLPALPQGTWQLDGQPLPGHPNPFVRYQQQAPGVLAWLSEQLGLAEDELPPCTGLALFEAPLTFGPEVEAQLHRHAATTDFQLVGDAALLPARLRQSPGYETAVLTDDELLEWGQFLADEPASTHEHSTPHALAVLLAHKLRQLWRWLGAEDIPADPPYGGGPPDLHLRDQQERARLQQLRHELQAELHQQRQEAATREAARTQELALLRQQLAQAGPSATERQAEQQAKKALEESLRTARAELATRNHELDARIQQLGRLIAQLQATPAAVAVAAPRAAPATAPKRQPTVAPAWSFRRLRRAERWSLVLLAVASVGVGTWGVVRWASPAAPHPATTAASRSRPTDGNPEENQFTQNDPTDSLAQARPLAADTLATLTTEPALTNAEPATTDKETVPSEVAPVETIPVSTEATTPTEPTTTTDPSTPSPEAVPEPSPTP